MALEMKVKTSLLEDLLRVMVITYIIALVLFVHSVKCASHDDDLNLNSDERDVKNETTLDVKGAKNLSSSDVPDIFNHIMSQSNEIPQFQKVQERKFTDLSSATESILPTFGFNGSNLDHSEGWDSVGGTEEIEKPECFKLENFNSGIIVNQKCDVDPDALEAISELCRVPEFSCKGRCNEVDNYEQTCFCDPKCIVYGKCCEDFEQECPNTYAQSIRTNQTGFYGECSPIVSAMLISKCPVEQRSVAPSLVKLCESDVINSQFSRLIPVTDYPIGHHFKNKYCWKCWEMRGQMIPWSANIIFNSRNRQPFDESLNGIENIVKTIKEHPLQIIWEPPHSTMVHWCDICSISACTGCSDRYLDEKCKTTMATVKIGGKFYKNKYCYLCSIEHLGNSHNGTNLGEGAKKQKCTAGINPHIPDGLFEPGPIYNYFEFNVILDMTDDEITLYQANTEASLKFPWRELKCQENKSLTSASMDDDDVGMDGDELLCNANSCALPTFPNEGVCDGTMVSVFFQITFCISNNCGGGMTTEFRDSRGIPPPPIIISLRQMEAGIQSFMNYLEIYSSEYFQATKMTNVRVVSIDNHDFMVHFNFASLDVFRDRKGTNAMHRFLFAWAAHAFTGIPESAMPFMCISTAHDQQLETTVLDANLECLQLQPFMVDVGEIFPIRSIYPSNEADTFASGSLQYDVSSGFNNCALMTFVIIISKLGD